MARSQSKKKIKPLSEAERIAEIEELARQMHDEVTGLFQVYDPDTKEVILTTTDFWEAQRALFDGTGIWTSTRNNLRVRKVRTAAAKLLFDRPFGSGDPSDENPI